MNRLYAVEGRYTLTGGMADHRLRVPASQTLKVAVDLAKAVATATGHAGLGTAAGAVKVAGEFKFRDDYAAWIKCAADDLVAAKGKSVVVAGTAHSAGMHALVALMNEALGAYGATVEVRQTGVPIVVGGVAELIAAATAQQVETLMVVGEIDQVLDASGESPGASLNTEPSRGGEPGVTGGV